MKKIILAATSLCLCLCLVACGKVTNETTLTSLANQLDRTSASISEVGTISPTNISVDESKSKELFSESKQTQDFLLAEQYYRTKILEKTAKIKHKLSYDVKLSRQESSGLKDLILSLNKYTDLVDKTKGEMTTSARSISTLKKDVSKNERRLGAKINRLICNSNMRSAYYENILQTLDEVDSYFEDSEEQPVQQETADVEVTKTGIEEDDDKTRTFPNLPRNIDTYGPRLRNIDNFYGGYGRMYGGYGYNMPYGYNYGRPMPPMGPNGMYGSNYYNRMTTPQFGAMPVNTENEEEDEHCKDCSSAENDEIVSATAHKLIKMPKHTDDDKVVVAH